MNGPAAARPARSSAAFPKCIRLLAVLLAMVLLAACSTHPETTPSTTPVPTPPATPTPILESGLLRLWMTPLDRLDPIRSRNARFLAVCPLLYDSLFTLDGNDEPQPRLCEASYFTNQDSTEWTFPMLTGVSFNDGTSLQPVDVAASANLWLAQGTGDAHDALVALSPQFLVNDGSLFVRLAKSEPDLPRLLRFAVIPSSYAIAKSPDPTVPVPGTGLFRIVSYQAGKGLRLERNLPVAGHVQSIFVFEYRDEATALEDFHSDLLDAMPLDETSYRTLRLRKSLKISRYDGARLVIPVFGTTRGRRLSDEAHQAVVRGILVSLFESDEFLAEFSVFPSSRGLSTGLASLVYGSTPAVATPATTPTSSATAIPTGTPAPLSWTGTLDVLAVTGSFEAEVGAAIVARLRSHGIAASLRTLPEANCMVAFNNGWYDIAIRTRSMPAVPGEPATASFATRSGTPFPDPLIRSRGVLLGPRVFGEPVPCMDEIYRGIEDAWVWSGS